MLTAILMCQRFTNYYAALDQWQQFVQSIIANNKTRNFRFKQRGYRQTGKRRSAVGFWNAINSSNYCTKEFLSTADSRLKLYDDQLAELGLDFDSTDPPSP